MVITIVGSGASALALLYNLLQQAPEDTGHATTIYLVEKRGTFGPGAAYAEDAASNLLNTKTGFITPFHDRPGDFLQWLKDNERLWQRAFPEFRPDPDSYAPRPLFGLYMQSRMAWIVKEALKKTIRIIQVDAEAVDVAKVGENFVTRTNCTLSLTSNYVFLCCGTMPARQPTHAEQSGRVLATPYPISELPRTIPADASVGIIGARLSCIDAVIGLIEGGHRGPITIHSRSGHFPSVRGTQGRITPRLLTADHIDALVRQKGKLSLRDLVQLVVQEMSLQSNQITTFPVLPPAPPASLADYLDQEIALAGGARLWQAVLYATNPVIDKLWNALTDGDKAELLARYFSTFMAYRVSIPVENARKIRQYLQQGQLSFVAGDMQITPAENGGMRVATSGPGGQAGTCREYDYLVNATGSPRAVTELDSRLIANLLAKGTLAPHRFGGVAIDPETYAAVNAHGVRDPRLFVLGELTVGTFFFISALDINARHARKCALAFADAITQRHEPEDIELARHG
jgi:uncharacterized NAD(P)/FAD-binding protein YdhS